MWLCSAMSSYGEILPINEEKKCVNTTAIQVKMIIRSVEFAKIVQLIW